MVSKRTKESIIEEILTERRRLEKNLSALSPDLMTMPGVVGTWSVKDIMAHLTAWEQLFLGWYDAGLRGEVPETPAPGFTWANYHLLNQKIYEDNRARTLEDVQESFDSHYRITLERIRSIPEEEWFEAAAYAWMEEGWPLYRYVLANTSAHYRWAKKHIRKWAKEHNIF